MSLSWLFATSEKLSGCVVPFTSEGADENHFDTLPIWAISAQNNTEKQKV